ncbi:hypothetical protein IHE44_0012749, partial [Lamprotornis superbus]
MASLDLPYRCPRCGEHKRFRSLSSLRAHLEYNHTYETLYTNSICDAAVFPLAADGALLAPATRRDYFESTSFQGKDQRFSCDLVPAEELEPAPSSSPSPRYVHEIEIPLSEIFTRGKAVAPAPAPPAAMDAAYEEGLARLKIRAFEKLEVDKRLEKLTEEVEQKIASQVGRLQVELDRKSSELEKAKQESLRLSREKQELEDRASELSRQVDVSVEMLASLKQDLVQKEQELTRKQQSLCPGVQGQVCTIGAGVQVCTVRALRSGVFWAMWCPGVFWAVWHHWGVCARVPREVLQIDQFLKETAAREANAKVRLQHFIEELLDRADRAEKQLQIISSSCGTTPNGSLGRCGTPGTKAMARAVPLRAQARARLRERGRDCGNAAGGWGTCPGVGERARGLGNAAGDSGTRPGIRERGRGFGNMSGDLGMPPGVRECPRGFGNAPGGWAVPRWLFSSPVPAERAAPGAGGGRARASSRPKAVSQSSGCYDSDSAELCPTDDTADGHPYSARGSGLRRQAIQNWHRRPYRNSTEGEEGDVSDVGSRTTESEAEGWEPEAPGSAAPRAAGSCRLTVATDAGCPMARPEGAGGKVCRLERGSPGHCSEVISPEILKMRAALFCIFTYLDTKTLLRAAEVCKDWKFVARHPAVWTRVLLENARVSSKFLAMLSQWCTQMHSLTLQNLKPRQRGKKESKEDYMKSTRPSVPESPCPSVPMSLCPRVPVSLCPCVPLSPCPPPTALLLLSAAAAAARAPASLSTMTPVHTCSCCGFWVPWSHGHPRDMGCLEAGLESLLKATGSNLLILRISHCPNVLTDRSLWLASCYCRALQAVTYRQQPTRFSNRCLQMIGRCWPHLRALGVGGAGCGVQGLASLARNCMRLQVLELDHVAEINQEVAAEVCREGLKGLEMLVLTSTPVTPKALLHFNSVCRNLKSIVVQVGIVDYFKEPHSPEARKMFEEMVNKLQ